MGANGCFFFFQFCDLAIVATIHEKKEPNLAIDQRGISKILLCFGNLKELNV
jgi:hypothetical protein